MWIVFSYIWLPFMILPIWSAIERVPDSMIEASADLGERSWRTFRWVLFPMILPGIPTGLHGGKIRGRSIVRFLRERRTERCR
jgi:putative spermidine/putrescine transport system permease protein